MKKSGLLVLVAVLMAMAVMAQDQKQWYTIHEDVVIPSQNDQYVKALKDLKAACQKYNVAVNWVTVKHDDNTYIHLSPIKNFADLDKEFFGDLIKKMGKDAFGKLMSEFDGCYDTHSDFVAERMTSYSYLAPVEGENYRDALYWTVEPGKEKEAENIIMEWKKLYERKKVPNGFMPFKVVYGRSPGYAIVGWGKDEVDYATKEKKTHEMIGKDADDLMKRTMAITLKMWTKRGQVMADYSMPIAAN